MSKKSCFTLGLAVILAALAGSTLAQDKNDFPTATLTPPTPNVSENYPLNYVGGVPAPITGALDSDDSTYNRVVTCGSLSGVGTAVFYDTISITNNAFGAANFIAETSTVGAPGTCAVDTFLTAYAPTFNPASPLTGCIAADDDGGPNNCSRMTFSVPLGNTAVIVVSSFSNGALFTWQTNFTGTTPAELTKFTIE